MGGGLEGGGEWKGVSNDFYLIFLIVGLRHPAYRLS